MKRTASRVSGIVGLVMVAFVCFLTPQYGLAADGEGEKLHKLFEEEWEMNLKSNPIFASEVGDHRYDDRLPSVTEADYKNQQDYLRDLLDRLKKIDRSSLNADDRVSYDIFQKLKENEIAELEFKTYLMPITNRSGFHVSFPNLPNDTSFETVKDYDNYIARLAAFKTYTDQHIALMRTGLAGGYVLPKVVMVGFEQSIEPHIVSDPSQSLLFKPFEALPENIGSSDRNRLLKAGSEAINNSVVPAYREFLAFMKDEYYPGARKEIGASNLPNGKAYYEHRVRYYTTLNRTPREVHDIGKSEVKRIRSEMQQIIDGVEFEGSFQDFVEFLRTDDQFYVTEPDQLMKEVALVLKKMDGELPKLFKTMPKMPYGIKPVPDYIAPKTTTAYYERPAGDGTRAGFYYVNTYNLKSRPLYEVEALSLHEAVPGHHFQIALMQELENIPQFRRFTGFTAFVEGWALYSERLGLETGFYEDPYSDFGRLTYEMWRACRLVVDTGLHYFGWSRQQAIDFMAENTALAIHNITTEVDRYISWPGQALAYKTGELKIRELRALGEKRMGDDFDVREFHDVVLGSGAVPLSVLEENVLMWLDRQMEK